MNNNLKGTTLKFSVEFNAKTFSSRPRRPNLRPTNEMTEVHIQSAPCRRNQGPSHYGGGRSGTHTPQSPCNTEACNKKNEYSESEGAEYDKRQSR